MPQTKRAERLCALSKPWGSRSPYRRPKPCSFMTGPRGGLLPYVGGGSLRPGGHPVEVSGFPWMDSGDLNNILLTSFPERTGWRPR